MKWAVIGTLVFLLFGLSGCRSECGASSKAAHEPTSLQSVQIVRAGPGPVAPIIQELRKKNPKLVVYVGATWCEPCRYFHDAAAAGALDETFPGVTILEFDYDADIQRLEPAGYGSNTIPLFVIPRADGTASERRFQGSIKGPAAVQNIVPRLKRLLSATGSNAL
jgi:thiol-disulfide isomerase/thioredoxin